MSWWLVKKANFQGAALICDKALSSKYVYSPEVYKHNLINHWQFLIKEFFNILLASSAHRSGKSMIYLISQQRKLQYFHAHLQKTEPLSECQ